MKKAIQIISNTAYTQYMYLEIDIRENQFMITRVYDCRSIGTRKHVHCRQ